MEVRADACDPEFRVLGPVEVIRDGRPVEFGGGTLAKLLAGLLLSANRVASGDVLTDAVWDGHPPVHPRAALHTGIARLRRALGGDLIETLVFGYRLRTDAGHLDLLRFEELITAAGQAGSAEAAGSALAGAIGLWRGQPFENVDSPLLNEAVPRLTRRYLGACEQWAELHLRRRDAAAARSTFTAVLSIVRLTNHLIGEAHALVGLGEALTQDGQADRAEHALQSALQLAGVTRKRMIQARALLALSDLNAARGRKADARRQVAQSLAIFHELAARRWQQRASEALRALDGRAVPPGCRPAAPASA